MLTGIALLVPVVVVRADENQQPTNVTDLNDEELLKRLERAPFGSADLITGGGNFFSGAYHAGVAGKAESWEREVGKRLTEDATIREVIRRGDAILPKIRERLEQIALHCGRGKPPLSDVGGASTSQKPNTVMKFALRNPKTRTVIENPLGNWGNPDIVPAYLYIAGEIGDRETIASLIHVMRSVDSDTGDTFNPPQISRIYTATSALWKLTGRRHCLSPDEWERWLEAVGDGFVLARHRESLQIDAASFQTALKQLRTDPLAPREWLIAQGPNVVPLLLNALPDQPREVEIPVAWALDELEATSEIPLPLRRSYFASRLSLADAEVYFHPSPDNANQPIELAARRRALEHLSLADFATVSMTADESLPDSGPFRNMAAYERVLELTRHENSRVRRSAVFTLCGEAPRMLHSELARLADDKDPGVRQKCIQVLSKAPDRGHTAVLIGLIKAENEFLRQDAVSALGHPEYKASVDRLATLLSDDELCGWAASSTVSAAGTDALPLFFAELRAGNDAQGMIYQHLERLTGATPDRSIAAWLKWEKSSLPSDGPKQSHSAATIY